MSLKVSDSGGGDFKILPSGTHIAVCTQLIDVGLQETPWGNKAKVWIQFEVPSERVEIDGKDLPMIVWANYTASLSEKANLRHDLEGWRGRAFTPDELKGFDLKSILGKACMISVVHRKPEGSSRTYANIQSISALPKGTTAPQPEGPLVSFDIDAHTPDEYQALPEWLQKKVDEGKENSAAQPETADNEPPPLEDDDIPF